MTTVYLSKDTPVVDYSQIMDSVLLNLRKELRTDLSQISQIEWNDETQASKRKKVEQVAAFDLK